MQFTAGQTIDLGTYAGRDFPVGTTLSVVSREHPVFENGGVRFGCQLFSWAELREANATIDFGKPEVQATAVRTVDFWSIGGRNIGHGDLRDYARSEATVIRAAEVLRHVSLRNGMFTCEAHPGEHFFVLSSSPIDGTSRVARLNTDRAHGDIGTSEGFAFYNLCRPVRGATFTTLFGSTKLRDRERPVRVTVDQFPGVARVAAP